LKSWHLDRRVGALLEKLKSVSSDVIRIDFDSFSELRSSFSGRFGRLNRSMAFLRLLTL
jgi:hypothetical protein